MNISLFTITNNNVNNKQYCKEWEKNFSFSSFTTNRKSYCICNAYHVQNRKAYQQKIIYKQQNPVNVNQMAIEFHDFYDFIA